MERSRGRPPGATDETRERVLQAAFHLLATEGPAAVTPLRINRETGVARTTIYRHWPTPSAIVRDILAQATARNELDDLSGELRHDLAIAVDTLIDRFEHRPVATLFRATMEAGEPDDPMSMSRDYIAGLLAPIHDVLASAVASGELVTPPGATDAHALTAELVGPILLDHLLLGRPVDRGTTSARVADFLRRRAAGS